MLLPKGIFTSGIRLVYTNSKFAVFFWLTNFAFGLALTLPIYSIFQDNLGFSLLSEKIYENVDYIWLIQFVTLYDKSLSAIPWGILTLSGVFIIIQNFYVAGLVSIFSNPNKNHMVDFFYGGVKYFSRFIKITFYAFFWYGLLLGVNSIIDYYLRAAFFYSTYTNLELIIQMLRYAVLLLIIITISVVSDYTKILIVIHDSNSLSKVIVKAMLFIKKNFVNVLSLFLILFTFLSLGGVVYNAVDGWIPKYPVYFIILSFVISQMLIIFRIIIKMLVYSTEFILYRDKAIEPIQINYEEIEKEYF